MEIGQMVEYITEWGNNPKARRAGWNGKGMWVYYVPGLNSVQGYVMLHTAQDGDVPWTCSQSDLLAEDWEEC